TYLIGSSKQSVTSSARWCCAKSATASGSLFRTARQEVLSPVSLAAFKARANRKTDVRHVISLAFMPAVRDSGGNKGCLHFFWWCERALPFLRNRRRLRRQINHFELASAQFNGFGGYLWTANEQLCHREGL